MHITLTLPDLWCGLGRLAEKDITLPEAIMQHGENAQADSHHKNIVFKAHCGCKQDCQLLGFRPQRVIWSAAAAVAAADMVVHE